MRRIFSLFLMAMAAAGQQPEAATIARLLQAGHLREALTAIDAARTTDAQNARLLLLRAKVLDELGRSSDSIAAYREILAAHPNMPLALKGLAETQYRAGDPGAVATLTAVLAGDAGDRTAHAMLGVLSFEGKRYDSAADHFRAAGPMLDNDPAALWQYGQTLLILRQAKEAAIVFRRLLEGEPSSARLRFNLALALHESKEAEQAKRTLQGLLDQPKPAVEALSLMASIHLTLGQANEAIDLLRRAASLYPENDQPYADLAAVCMDRSAFTTGVQILDAGIKNLPRARRLYAIRGAFHAQLGEYEKAHFDFAQADQDGVAGRSVALQEAGKLDDSIMLLRDQVEKHAHDGKLWYLLGEMILKQDIEPVSPEYADARQALEKALHLEPSLVEARVALGKVHLRQGHAEQAVREFERAIAADPENRTAVFKLSQALRQLGRKDEAAKLSARVAQMLSQDLRRDSSGAASRVVQRAPARIAIQDKQSRTNLQNGR